MAEIGRPPEFEHEKSTPKSFWVRWRARLIALPTIGFLLVTFISGPVKKAYDDVVGSHLARLYEELVGLKKAPSSDIKTGSIPAPKQAPPQKSRYTRCLEAQTAALVKLRPELDTSRAALEKCQRDYDAYMGIFRTENGKKAKCASLELDFNSISTRMQVAEAPCPKG